MKSSNHKTNLWFLGLLALLCFASCVKHEYINRPPSVDDPGNTSGSEYPCDTCGGTDPMERLRWLGQLALQYDTDSINHLSVFRCLTSDGSERFLVAVSAQYPFDSASATVACTAYIRTTHIGPETATAMYPTLCRTCPG